MSEDLFELTDLLRQGRLGEVKAQRGASEVQLLCDRDEVAEMAKFNVSIHILKIIMRTNKILDVSTG
jgi:hypothetical protein